MKGSASSWKPSPSKARTVREASRSQQKRLPRLEETMGVRETVVITGATAGVGRATARELARRGARIGLLARGDVGLEATRREVEELGGEALCVPTDVADAEQVDAAATAVEQAFGAIDVWINNAMVTVFAPFEAITPAEFRRVTEVTYLGAVHGTMAALARMFPRDRGTIVQVGSALAYRSIPLQSAWCGAKFAIRGFTDSLRSELLHDGRHIHLTMVQLPAVNTPPFGWCRARLPNEPQPVPPIFQPEVAARAICFAAHARRREVWVGASAVQAIVGNKLLPGVGDRYLAHNGYSGQQTDEPVEPGRPDNLFAPVPGDFGARGAFDDRARGASPLLRLTMHRGRLVGGLLAAAAVALGARIGVRRLA